MVDWSAASVPGPRRPSPDRCWIGSVAPGDAAPQAVYCRTRAEAEARVATLLRRTAGPVLVGFDFPFGYPAGSGMGGGRPLAARLATLIEDAPDGRNNRFAVAARLNAALNDGRPGPFWGCPPAAESATLPARKRDRRGGPFAESRLAESRLAGRGIQSCWKLYTRGSVGSQILLGLPAVHRLLADPAFGHRCRLWPFETGWDATLDAIVIAEIWPSLFAYREVDHPIRDARQVIAACAWAGSAQRKGLLRQAFARPADLTATDAARCLAEEGWILGLGTGLA